MPLEYTRNAVKFTPRDPLYRFKLPKKSSEAATTKHVHWFDNVENCYTMYKLFKDWSQFFVGSWKNKLKNVVHTV